MDFMPHPLLPNTHFAVVSPYSFIVMLDVGSGKWHTSWQDLVKGGSASSTLEGPFNSRPQAEANCRHIYKTLKRNPIT
jgi:hypothetical protein